MEIYNKLDLTVETPEQAALFIDEWKAEWPTEAHPRGGRTWEDEFSDDWSIVPRYIEKFRAEGGRLRINEFNHGYAELYCYDDVCKKLAEAFPQHPFTLHAYTANYSSEGEDANLFEYRDGTLKITRAGADTYIKDTCINCCNNFVDSDEYHHNWSEKLEREHTGLGRSYNLIEWVRDGKKAVCPRCGRPVFSPDEYVIAYDSIAITRKQGPVSGVSFPLELPAGTTSITFELIQSVRDRLTEAVIPEGVTEIKDRAFKSCRNLQTVALPESLKTIGDEAFKGCCRLSRISVPGTNVALGYEVFFGCNRLKNASGAIILNQTVGEASQAGILQQPDTGRHSAGDVSLILTRQAEYTRPSLNALYTAAAGETVQLGVFPQDESFIPSGIWWHVLRSEGNRKLLLAEKGLVFARFSEESDESDWKDSTVRAWLNGDFYHFAFSPEEQALIETTQTENTQAEPEALYDKVFLLSAEEIVSNRKFSEIGLCRTTRYAPIPVYGTGLEEDSGSSWWTRTPAGKAGMMLMCTGARSSFMGYGACWGDPPAVRPAIWVRVPESVC